MSIKKCVITRYDETIKKPPYLTIPIDNVEVFQPDNDEGGVDFANNLRIACSEKGYTFRFYSSGVDYKDVDFEIVVY